MHIMEEGNAKVTADAAELPQAQPDLPKKACTPDKASEAIMSSDVTDCGSRSPTPPSTVNGITTDGGHTPGKKNLEKLEPKKENDGKLLRSCVVISLLFYFFYLSTFRLIFLIFCLFSINSFLFVAYFSAF